MPTGAPARRARPSAPSTGPLSTSTPCARNSAAWGAHPKVLAYCTQETLAENAFHASLEAAKSVFDRLRLLTGQQLDGARLVDAVLMPGAAGAPRVAINTGVTATERDEQKGFASLIKGLSSMYRNPAAHDPRLNRPVGDEELLELLTTLSMVHRRLDAAQ